MKGRGSVGRTFCSMVCSTSIIDGFGVSCKTFHVRKVDDLFVLNNNEQDRENDNQTRMELHSISYSTAGSQTMLKSPLSKPITPSKKCSKPVHISINPQSSQQSLSRNATNHYSQITSKITPHRRTSIPPTYSATTSPTPHHRHRNAQY